jgi:two-component system CheB/CheR fusion protein
MSRLLVGTNRGSPRGGSIFHGFGANAGAGVPSRPAGANREQDRMSNAENASSRVMAEWPLLKKAVQAVSHRNMTAHTEEGRPPDEWPKLRDLLNSLPAAVYTTDSAGRITFYNESAAELWGCRPKLNSDLWCGSWRLYRPDGTLLPHDQCPMAIALKEGRAIRGAEAAAERPDGTRVPFMAFPSPLRDSAGTIIGAVNMLVDITERKHGEELGHWLSAIIESSDDAIISKDLNGIIASWNEGAARLFGYNADEAIGRPVTLLIPPERHDEEIRILERLRRGERIDHYETVRRRKNGEPVEVSLTVSPVKDVYGRIIGASKVVRDIGERKQREQRVALLAREVDHRSKNLLALVQAMVHLTQADSVPELKASIQGRLQALANAHALLAQSRWEGVDLCGLVAEELSPYCQDDARRAEIDGPYVMLEPTTTQSIAVALHELTTNAVKYGALSVSTGSLHVSWWRSDEGGLVLRWVETGGPPVEPPRRRGFGTAIVERMIRDQLQGEVHMDWREQGLVCEISMRDPTSGGSAD